MTPGVTELAGLGPAFFVESFKVSRFQSFKETNPLSKLETLKLFP
jgi:hypothetical protein